MSWPVYFVNSRQVNLFEVSESGSSNRINNETEGKPPQEISDQAYQENTGKLSALGSGHTFTYEGPKSHVILDLIFPKWCGIYVAISW